MENILGKTLHFLTRSQTAKYIGKRLQWDKLSRFIYMRELTQTLKNNRDQFIIARQAEVLKSFNLEISGNCNDALCFEKIKNGITAYPRISIVTPNYNQGRFLEACIESVLSQQYSNLEYIIIDGGSTDNSVEVIKKHEHKISYWVSEKDNGQADAINKGLQHATGKIFNWLNSDDRLMPGALYRCAATYQEIPHAVGWIGSCKRTDEHGAVTQIVYPNGLDRENIGQNWNGKQFYQPSCFLDAEKVKEIEGLNSDLYIALDLDLWLRILAKGGKFAIGRGIWSEAIDHADAKTQKFIGRMFQETSILQENHGFSEGAHNRLNIKRNRLMRYCVFDTLKNRLEKISDSPGIVSYRPLQYERSEHICFIGDFNSEYDVEAVLFFVKYIFPEILKRHWVELHVIGKHVEEYGRKIILRNVRFINHNQGLENYLTRYKLFVCPMLHAGGMPGKIRIAAAAGVPIVTTTIGSENLPLRDGEECFIADSPAEFAGKCIQLLGDQMAWNNFSIKGRLMLADVTRIIER